MKEGTVVFRIAGWAIGVPASHFVVWKESYPSSLCQPHTGIWLALEKITSLYTVQMTSARYNHSVMETTATSLGCPWAVKYQHYIRFNGWQPTPCCKFGAVVVVHYQAVYFVSSFLSSLILHRPCNGLKWPVAHQIDSSLGKTYAFFARQFAATRLMLHHF